MLALLWKPSKRFPVASHGAYPGVKAFVQNVLGALVSGETLSLVAIILLVLYLGTLLQAKGNFKTLVDSLKNLIAEPRLILALPPAFIGLLPMLGGALMSAPIVEEASERWKLSPPLKTFLNYWTPTPIPSSSATK
jgi:hypothetical protein